MSDTIIVHTGFNTAKAFKLLVGGCDIMRHNVAPYSFTTVVDKKAGHEIIIEIGYSGVGKFKLSALVDAIKDNIKLFKSRWSNDTTKEAYLLLYAITKEVPEGAKFTNRFLKSLNTPLDPVSLSALREIMLQIDEENKKFDDSYMALDQELDKEACAAIDAITDKYQKLLDNVHANYEKKINELRKMAIALSPEIKKLEQTMNEIYDDLFPSADNIDSSIVWDSGCIEINAKQKHNEVEATF